MELMELPCDETLKAKYDTVGPAQFIRSISEAMHQLRLHVARTLCMFGSTYDKVIKLNKTAHWSPLTDEPLQSLLGISTTESYTKPKCTCCQEKMPNIQL